MPEALLALEEHSFRLPLTLPAERHVRSIIPPPPPPPTFDHDELGIPPFRAHDGSLEPTHLPRDLSRDLPTEPEPSVDPRDAEPSEVDDDDDELLAGERLRRARQASIQRWALLVTAPLAVIVIAALVRTAVIWGRAPSSAELHAANVATATAPIPSPPTATVNAAPLPPAPEPPAPMEKAAPPPSTPSMTAEEQLAHDRAAAKTARLDAQTALEVGDARRAALAAKRATTLDPTEAQGWLILVAAELDCKRPVAANEALASCLKVATRGPRGECIGMVVGRAARAKKTMDLKSVGTTGGPSEPSPSPLSASPPPVPRSAP